MKDGDFANHEIYHHEFPWSGLIWTLFVICVSGCVVALYEWESIAHWYFLSWPK
jgi:hypothetical protein